MDTGTPRKRQAAATSFKVEGWKVSWQNWSFRVGFTAREGLVLHQIAFRDGAAIGY